VNQTFEIQARQKGIKFNIDLDPAADKVFLIDDSRLRQVLFNLVGNAIKFTHEGQVDLTVKAKPSILESTPEELLFGHDRLPPAPNVNLYDLEFAVKDTGIGIAEKDRQAIFEVFNQLSRGAGRKYEGTGLGLNISRRIVELMNGSIEVESQPGKGSTFRVKLPRVKAV
jgi:two-component system, NarL family, sensor histidine kinase EvgS